MINTEEKRDIIDFVTVEYCCDSCTIFEGFYNSNLWDSDTLYDDSMNDRSEGYLKENQEYDIIDWDGYRREVCKDVAVLLYEEGVNHSDNIVDDIDFIRMSSPRYYNYETDKFIADVKVNLENLKRFCFKSNKDNFNKYLKEKYTSYDGYMSFMPNNVEEFTIMYHEGDGRCIDVMLDYYFLSNIYNDNDVVKSIKEDYNDTTYHYRLYEYNLENIYNYREPVYNNETRYHKVNSVVPEWDLPIPEYVRLTNKEKIKRIIDKVKFIITFEIKNLLKINK